MFQKLLKIKNTLFPKMSLIANILLGPVIDPGDDMVRVNF